MFGIGMTELMVIFVIGLLVLGPKRLPELARSLGKSLAEFRRASNEMRREFMSVADDGRIEPPTLAPPRAPAATGSADPPQAGTEPDAKSEAAKPAEGPTDSTHDG